jgi:hypothetical protein
MQIRLIATLVVCTISLGSFAAESLSQAMPKGAIGYVEFNGLGNKLFQLRDSDSLKTFLTTPQYKQLVTNPEFNKVLAGKAMVEGVLGMDLWTAADKLLNEATLGVYPDNGGELKSLLMFRMQGEEALTKVVNMVNALITLADNENVKRQKNGELQIISLDESVFLAFQKDWVVVAASRDLLDQAIVGLSGRGAKSMSEDLVYKKVKNKMPGKHLARGFFNLPAYAKLYNQPLEAPGKMSNGGASFFLHGIIELAADSPYLGLTLDTDKSGFSLVGAIEGDVNAARKKYGWFLSDPTTPGTRDIPQVSGLMGGITLHRNIGDWYKNREDILEEHLMAGFDQFESEIGNLFPNQDVGEDIMPAIGSTITLMAAKQTFEHFDGEPGIKLPGFALIFDLDKPENGGLFQLVFQTVVTILNITAAEQGLNRAPSVMTAVVHKGIPINTVQFLKKPKDKRLDISYNFMPCATTVNGRFVFCTSLNLCKALVEELAKPQDKTRVNRNFNFELFPGALSNLVKVNRSTLVARSIQEGKTIEQARGEIDLVDRLLQYVKLLRLSTSVKKDGFQLQFSGQWK